MKKKILLSLILILSLSSCNNRTYYPLGHKWTYDLDDTNYNIEYFQRDNKKIGIIVDASYSMGNKLPLYFETSKYISYINCNGNKYDKVVFGSLYGELPVTTDNEKLLIYCYLTNKGKKTNNIDVTVFRRITTLMIGKYLKEIHCIRIYFK